MMDDQLKAAYQTMSSPYCQTLSGHPSVVVIQESGLQLKKSSGNEQQKLASQRPRGTRIDDTGTRIQVKGGRNYTSRNLHISREEMFDDVVVRGLRADGLSTKLGVKNHKDGIRKLLSELFQGDSRLAIIEEHFRTHRQKSNCAKTMFATMTHEELQFLKAETFPSRIDVQVRDYLTNAFSDQPQKLQATFEVLAQVQHIFKALTPHADFLSSHNFQTRGFFLDIILMTCSFLMQIIQDSDANPEPATSDVDMQSNVPNIPEIDISIPVTRSEEKNKSAAEILLSVGSDILDSSDNDLKHSIRVQNRTRLKQSKFESSADSTLNEASSLPTTIVVEGSEKPDEAESEEWTTVEMVDNNGNSRYVLIKTNNDEGETFDTMKILNLLQSQGVNLDEKLDVATDNAESSDKQGEQSMQVEQKLEELKENLVINMETGLQERLELEEVNTKASTDVMESKNVVEKIQAHDSTEDLKERISGEIISQVKEISPDSELSKESRKRSPLTRCPTIMRKKAKPDTGT